MSRPVAALATAALLLCWAAVAPASAEAAHEVCYVDVYASDELNTSAGYGVRYSLDCNVRLRGYQVTSNRIGMPRDDPNMSGQDYYYPAYHSPSFRCDTWYYNNYNGASPSQEFVCQDFEGTYPDYAGGYWNATQGPPVCQSPKLQWSFNITALDGTKLYGTFPIRCGSQGDVGGETGDGDGGDSGREGSGTRVPTLGSKEAIGRIRWMIKVQTGRKARGLRKRCRRISRTSIRCKIRFWIRKRGRRVRYKGTARISHVPESVDSAGWVYRFQGKRRKAACSGRRCTRRARWAG